jgi:hypothetical protein
MTLNGKVITEKKADIGLKPEPGAGPHAGGGQGGGHGGKQFGMYAMGAGPYGAAGNACAGP